MNKETVKKGIHSTLRRSLGVEVHRVGVQAPPEPENLLYERDELFLASHNKAIAATQTIGDTQKRRRRFYDLLQWFKFTWELDGAMVECGCWKGLSSLMMCEALRSHDPQFTGQDYVIFDSFEGLSPRSQEDEITDTRVTTRDLINNLDGRHFAAAEQDVRAALKDFPEIEYVAGWLPQSLAGQPERSYRFVHVDVDLYEPTRGCIEYFYPRLISGGVLICDDYGSLNWPGAKQAIDDFCTQNNVRLVALSSASCVIIKS